MAARQVSKLEKLLRDYALSLPETREDFPWGERVIKVKNKVFVFLGHGEGDFGLSVKLPETGQAALSLPHTEPTGYGLGRSGWVSAQFPRGEEPPPELIKEWVLESYRAVAPVKLAKLVGTSGLVEDAPAAKAPTRKRARAR
jgi:predicted DNA-binding protein (MmcQ/YjbR family)